MQNVLAINADLAISKDARSYISQIDGILKKLDQQ